MLADEYPGMTFGEATTAAEAVEAVRTSPWDIVVLDISLPGRSGLDALAEIHAMSPNLPVLVMTMYGEEEYAVRAFRTGASGYITKGSAPEELLHAVQKVLSGGRYVSSGMAERLVGSLKTDLGRPPHESLSNREFQVLRMLAAGTTVKSIAHELVPGLRDALATEAIFPHDAGRLRGAAHDAVQGRRRGRHRHRPRREPLHRRLRASRRQARVRGQRLLRFRTTLFVGARPGQAPGPVNLVARRSLTPAAASR